MSREDQGRQKHGWFGNGTAPPKGGEGAGRGGAEGAETAAARAYAWAKAHGPVLFGLPKSGAMLDEFAEAVRRIERKRPGSIARALGSDMLRPVPAAREATGDGLLMPVRFTTNFKPACRVLGLNPNAASDALHAAKKAANVSNADDCTFDLDSGDILFNGESIGNLGD